MTTRPLFIALLATATTAMAASPAGAEDPGSSQQGTDVATALVARSTQAPSVPRDRPLRPARARVLLRRALQSDGYTAVSLRCAGGGPRRAQCEVASAQREGAAWAGHGQVAVGGQTTRVSYLLESQPA
jgi:hypothetical protein